MSPGTSLSVRYHSLFGSYDDLLLLEVDEQLLPEILDRSVSDLPSTPADRFDALFQERPKWAWKDLQAYVRDLQVPGLSSEALLIKYTQRTQPTADAEPIFSAR